MEEALHNASNADEFRMRVSGILSAEQAMNGMPPRPAASRENESEFVKH
jgi:hypothetical protein